MNLRHILRDTLSQVNINEKLVFLRESQFWNSEHQRKYQENKLQKVIKHAYDNVLYYNELFNSVRLKPYDIKQIEDLEKLPVLTKSIIKENFSSLLAKNHNNFKSQKRWTGGTTGEPLVYYSDKNSWEMHWALKYRAWEWAGYKFGDPIGIMGGASIIPDRKSGLKRKLWNQISNFYPLPSSNVNEQILFDYIKKIKQNNIQFIRGYPSSIANFANFILKNDVKTKIKSVITTAEVLTDEYKQIITDAFGCLLIDTYGCADGGGNANTCECNTGFHVSFEASIWEVCNENGAPTEVGQQGEVTLTSLTNYAMPLIRYQPGDVIENSFDCSICKCGRTLPRINRIQGRTTDLLKFANGVTLGGPAFTLLFREFPIEKYQMVQNDYLELDIYLIPGLDYSVQHKLRILELMRHHCGLEVQINIHEVSEIIIPKSGKHRFIVNNTK